jgi:hypothetical protein
MSASTESPLAVPLQPVALLTGTLHIYVAFDWGDEVRLDLARSLVPAEVHDLPRRRRTPPSIGYRPAPLRFLLEPVPLSLPELGAVQVGAEATVFDFAAVSVALHLPFRLPPAALARLAGHLAEPAPLVRAARAALQPLHRRLLPALVKPHWPEDLSEEYFVFQLPPRDGVQPAALAAEHPGWLARLLRLEEETLSESEIAEALRLSLAYTPNDLFIADWAAGVLIDQDCDETLQTIEFANLQLLEYRHIDNRLDDSLSAYGQTAHTKKTWRRLLLGGEERTLRALGEMKVEANGLFERTGNVLKLVGDQYLARVYRLVSTRFHLKEWERNIQRKLEVAEGVYQVLSDQADTHRTEFLEIIVIVLIVLEILLAFFHH